METLVAARVVTATGVHHWLRPLLVDLTTFELGHREGHALDEPDTSLRISEPLWSLVRPDRPEPVVRDAPGISLAELARAVDQLEAL